MSAGTADACDGELAAGALLADLERRQDEVLEQLDALDRQLTGLLRGLGVTLVDDAEAGDGPPQATDEPALDLAEPRTGESIPLSTGFAKLPTDHPVGSAASEQAA